MHLLFQQHDFLDRQIAEAEAQLTSLLDGDTARRLLTIPGVGPATAATFLAEIWDIWRFTDVDQLLAYAGVHPKEQSLGSKKGERPETTWAMAKTGNAYLRAAAYRKAVVGIKPNPVIRSHYAKKRAAASEPCTGTNPSTSSWLALRSAS
jgi:transposase